MIRLAFRRDVFFCVAKKCGACGTAALGAAVTLPLIGRGLFLRCWQPREITRFAGAGRWLGRPYAKRLFHGGGGGVQSVANLAARHPPAHDCQHARQMLVDASRSPQRGDGRGEKEKDPPTDDFISQRVYAHASLNHCITQRIRCQQKVPAPEKGAGTFFRQGAARARVSAARAAPSPPRAAVT